MLDVLKSLFENNVVSEDIRSEIEEAWNSKIKENRLQATAELREEFARKYEHDKSIMVEAVDAMLQERLTAEIEELREDRKQLAEAKAKYALAMRENSDLMKDFVVTSLAEEIKDLHDDQKLMAENFSKLEEFIVESLAKEIREFYEDKQDLAETKVRLVREGKKLIKETKEKFVKTSAEQVSNLVAKTLTREIGQLKEDIEVARKNDFGRKIFEAFSNEYINSYLNEKSETSKLVNIIKEKDAQLEENMKLNARAKTLLENAQHEKQSLVENYQREKTINELVAPLSHNQREVMRDLLESVQTSRLKTSFEKYLPSVTEGKHSTPAKKQALNEGTIITGNKLNTITNGSSENVVELRKLAGLT